MSTQRRVNPQRFAQLAAKQKPTVKTVGMIKAEFLQAEPVEDHLLPHGSESQHTTTRDCFCHPTVRQKREEWWRVQVTHYVPATDESGLAPDDPAWEDLKNLSPDAGLPPHLRRGR